MNKSPQKGKCLHLKSMEEMDTVFSSDQKLISYKKERKRKRKGKRKRKKKKTTAKWQGSLYSFPPQSDPL